MIEEKSAIISKVDENTVKVVFKPGALVTKEEYARFEDCYKDLMGTSKDLKFLVFVQQGFKIQGKYLQFFQKEYRNNSKLAEAYVIKNPSAKMFFRLGIKVIRKDYPIQQFDTEEEALSWLKTIH